MWHEAVRSFNAHAPTLPATDPPMTVDDEAVWDAVVADLYQARKQEGQAMRDKLDRLF